MLVPDNFPQKCKVIQLSENENMHFGFQESEIRKNIFFFGGEKLWESFFGFRKYAMEVIMERA